MNKTLIEWVKNPDGTQGYTWNPLTGCLNSCEYCYARKMANTRLRERYLANHNYIGQDTGFSLDDVDNLAGIIGPADDPFYPRFWEDRLLKPAKGLSNYLRTKPKGIFVCDMSDLFGIGIPGEWTRRVLDDCRVYHKHRFYLLTKQPQNLIKFSPFPDNCWVGVTITDYEMARRALPYLAQVEAKIKYVSYEPLLEQTPCKHTLELVDWVIIGSQTKPYKPPKIEWVQEIVEACDKAGVKVFLKDNLKLALAILAGDTSLIKNYELRQEMPSAER